MANEVSRRNFLQCSSLAGAGLAALAPLSASEKTYQKGASPWPICFNTSSIRPATLDKKIEVTVAAGYDGLEPGSKNSKNTKRPAATCRISANA